MNEYLKMGETHRFHSLRSQLLKPTLLSAEWVDYVEEPMKYQAILPNFGSMGGWLEGSWDGWMGGCWCGWWWGGWCACEGWVVGCGGGGWVLWAVDG